MSDYITRKDLDEAIQSSENRIVSRITKIINAAVTSLIANMVTTEELEATKKELKEDISHLPNKEELYTEMSKIYGRLDTIETEKDILSHQVTRNSDRLRVVEKKLQISST